MFHSRSALFYLFLQLCWSRTSLLSRIFIRNEKLMIGQRIVRQKSASCWGKWCFVYELRLLCTYIVNPESIFQQKGTQTHILGDLSISTTFESFFFNPLLISYFKLLFSVYLANFQPNLDDSWWFFLKFQLYLFIRLSISILNIFSTFYIYIWMYMFHVRGNNLWCRRYNDENKLMQYIAWLVLLLGREQESCFQQMIIIQLYISHVELKRQHEQFN